MVKRSSSPWVGCACRPSPAFTTCSCGLTWRAMRNGAPEELCRTTKMSACIADRFATVSSSDSPFDCEETAMFRLITSADRRFAAISKVVRVRVEGSKTRLKTLLPRSSGTFFTSRSVTPTNDSAVSRICVRMPGGSPSIDSRCCSSPAALSWGLRSTFGLQRERQLALGRALQPQAHAARNLHSCAAVLSADRQLAAAAVRQHDERNARRPAVVEELVHRRAHRAAGVEHVVHQQELAAVDVEWNLGALGIVMQALLVIVVAIERDVHQPERRGQRKQAVQPLREPGTAGVEPDHGALRSEPWPQLGDELLTQFFCVRQLRQSIAPAVTGRLPSRSPSSSRRAAGSRPPPN